MTLPALYRLAASHGIVPAPDTAAIKRAQYHLRANGGPVPGREITCKSVAIALASGAVFVRALLISEEIEALIENKNASN